MSCVLLFSLVLSCCYGLYAEETRRVNAKWRLLNGNLFGYHAANGTVSGSMGSLNSDLRRNATVGLLGSLKSDLRGNATVGLID